MNFKNWAVQSWLWASISLEADNMDRVGQKGSSANIGTLLEISGKQMWGRCNEWVSRTHWEEVVKPNILLILYKKLFSFFKLCIKVHTIMCSVILFGLIWKFLWWREFLWLKEYILTFCVGLMNGYWREFLAIFMDFGWKKLLVLMNTAIGLKR